MYYILIRSEKEILKEIAVGDRVSYARDCISEDSFRHLMNLLWDTEYYENPAFTAISWTILCRGITSCTQHLENFEWFVDSLRVNIPFSKSNEEGSISPFKYIFGNPDCLEVCIFVAVGFSVIENETSL
jgi:hypothetical protein